MQEHSQNTIQVHIDRLILDGIAVPHAQRPHLQAAVEAELTRLLTNGGIASHLTTGGTVPHLPGGAIDLSPHSNPTQLGHQIAHAVYRGIGQ
jgi:hypothetical protein